MHTEGFVKGFVKKAGEYGISKNAALMLLKQALDPGLMAKAKPSIKPTTGKPVLKPTMAAAPKPTPESPYLGNRATEEDLASFPISTDDWVRGGGTLIFQNNPTPTVIK